MLLYIITFLYFLCKYDYFFHFFSSNFIEALTNETGKNGLTPNAKMKLLNINGYAKLILENFKGPSLSPESDVYSVPLAHNKSKQILLNGTLDALKSLFPSTTCLKTLVDSKMGFLIGNFMDFVSLKE